MSGLVVLPDEGKSVHFGGTGAIYKLLGEQTNAHELRNEIKQSKQAIVGMKESLSSVKAKKVSGREERGEKKKSQLRGDVESAGTCLTRALNTKEGLSNRSQRRLRRPFHTVSETHMACRHAASLVCHQCEMRSGRWPFTFAGREAGPSPKRANRQGVTQSSRVPSQKGAQRWQAGHEQ